MEDNLFDIFDDLNIEQISLLLDQDFDLHIDKKVQKRIMDSVREKSQLSFNNNENILGKFRNILKSLFINKRLVTLCTIFILFLGSGGYLYAQVPVAYVSLDINPSIELALNKFNKVVSYEAYNTDGETLLASNDETHITVDNAINNIIDDAINKNYISSSKDSTITLSTISDDTILRKDLEIHLKDTIEKSLEDKSIHISINSSNNNLTKRDEAKSIGFTVGKLLLVQELKSLDSSIIIEDFKDVSISEIKNRILEFKNNKSNNDSTTSILDTNDGAINGVDKNTNTIDSDNSISNITPDNSNDENTPCTLPSNSNDENTPCTLPSNSNDENTPSTPPSNNNNRNTSNNKLSNSNNRNTSNNKLSNSNNGNTSNNKLSDSNNRNTSNNKLSNSNNGNTSNNKLSNSNNRNTPSTPPSNSNSGNTSNNKPDKYKYENYGHIYHKYDNY